MLLAEIICNNWKGMNRLKVYVSNQSQEPKYTFYSNTSGYITFSKDVFVEFPSYLENNISVEQHDFYLNSKL